MSLAPNYERGALYLWAPKGTMFFLNIGLGKTIPSGIVPLYIKRPKNSRDYLRVKITAVRTAREVALFERKMAKRRAKLRAV